MNNAPIAIRAAITLSLMALIVIASIIPGRAQPGDSVFVFIVAETPPLVQKLLHLSLYALLTLLCAWTLEAIEPRPLRMLLAATVAITLGAAMEWYQTKIPGRVGTLFDVALNSAGAALGLIAAIFLF
ncbi:MAG: VanZ family protein [Gammaproteobacteria bacterium]